VTRPGVSQSVVIGLGLMGASLLLVGPAPFLRYWGWPPGAIWTDQVIATLVFGIGFPIVAVRVNA
jgi:hypothetical protein